jgi:Arc/MetJ-type ribon-helix-helix transcriptional regulator
MHMSRAKIAITIDEEVLTEIDLLVRDGIFTNRSQAFEVAVKERLGRMQRTTLAREAAKLDRTEVQALADEVYAGEAEWPEYTAKLNEVYATEASALDPVFQSIQSRSVK